MVTATIATQVFIPGINSVAISNNLETGRIITTHVDLTEDPDDIKAFNLPDSILKMLLVKTKDNKYEIKEHIRGGGPLDFGERGYEMKYIKYRFKNDMNEPWIPLTGPLFVFGEKMIISLSSELKAMYFRNEHRREVILDVFMATNTV